jgi:hypothetical protein
MKTQHNYFEHGLKNGCKGNAIIRRVLKGEIMRPSRLRALVEYLLDNFFDILTILIAGYLVIRHQVQPFQNDEIAELATWILAVLGLIAVTGLWDRNRRLGRIEALAKESRDLIKHYVDERTHADDFFQPRNEISEQLFTAATTIYITGVTLGGASSAYANILRHRLVAGALIRIILIDPRDSVLNVLISRSWAEVAPDYYPNRIKSVEAQFEYIARVPGNKGKMEIGHLPFHPSFGLVFIDPDEPHGICYVNIYPHKVPGPQPSFEIRASDDPIWYSFFRQQFDVLWSSCRIETIPKEEKTGA